MFTKIKQQIKYLYNQVNAHQATILEMQKDLKEHIETRIDAVPCEVCGCILDVKHAIKGASTVESKLIDESYSFMHGFTFTQGEVIKEHYYCNIHAPKEKKVIKKTVKPVKKSNKK